MSAHAPLTVLSIGAGAIGSYIAASLHSIGSRVLLIERPHNIERLIQTGISLQTLGARIHIQNPELYPSLDAIPPSLHIDLAVFALKSYDTRAAINNLISHGRQLPPILCLQNGVENEGIITSAIGKENVIPGTVTTAIGKSAVGRMKLERLRGIGIGGEHPLTPAIMGSFRAAGLNPVWYRDSQAMKWSKLLTNLVANATSAILDLSPAEVYADPSAFRIERAMMLEATKVMRAMSLNVVDLPRTPVRAMVAAFSVLPSRLVRPILQRAIGAGRGNKMPSLHIDLFGGSKFSEVDTLNGAVARFGDEIGVATPVNRGLTDLLTAILHDPARAVRYRHDPRALYTALLG